MWKLLEKFSSRKFRGIMRKCIVGVLIFSISLNLFTVEAKADANEIISTYVSIAAGKQLSDLDVNSLSLSEKDLQFLGVYISNFFIPFGTELGDGMDDDVTTQNKDDIVKALQTSLNFSDSMAESLTDTILGLSMASAKELVLCVSTEYQKDLKPLIGGDGSATVPLNYYTALCGVLGGLPDIAEWYSGSEVMEKIADGTYKYGYFAYQGSSGYTPVFDFSLRLNSSEGGLTPSSTAFIKCLESADIKNGYGFNFFDFTEDELGDSEEEYSNKLGDRNDNEVYEMSIYGSKLRVDCFGNIILMGGNHQYILIPGCMNPYTWVTVDSDGKNVDAGMGGTAYNMVNIPSMSLGVDIGGDSTNSLLTSITDNNTGVGSDSVDDDITVTLGDSLSRDGGWVSYLQGTSQGAYNAENANGLFDKLKLVFAYASGLDVSKEDNLNKFNISFDENDIKVTAKASVFSALSVGRLSKEKIDNTGGAVKSTIDVLKDYSYGYNIDFYDSDVVADSISVMLEAGRAHYEDKNNSESSSGVGMMRVGSVNTKLLISKLREVISSGGGGRYSLRRVRGAFASSLKEGFLFGSNCYRDFVRKAENGFKEANRGAKNYYNGYNNLGIGEFGDYVDIYGDPLLIASDSSTEYLGKKTIDVLDSFVYIDNLGAAHFDNGDQAVDFSTFNVEHYLVSSSSTEGLKESMSSWKDSNNNGFTNTFKSLKNGVMSSPSVSDEALIGIYITYAYAGLYDSSLEAKQSTIGKIGYKLNSDALPAIPDKPLKISSEAEADYMLEAIRDWTYYLLHPTEGLDYFKIWITNKLNSFLLGWHDDMVGTNGTGSINGTTKYRGFSGYVTTPELTDIPWTDALLELYNNSIPFLLVVMILLMLASYIVGMLSLQKSIFGFFIFAVAIVLPPVLINGAVGTSNRFSSSLYGEKFTYWALIQHESYSTSIDKAVESGSYANYLRTLYEKNAKATGNQGSESIMLKWQAPKKMASLMLTENDRGVFDSLTSSSLISGLINATYSGESYLDNEDSVYLYRSYIDIANFSRYIHRGLSGTYAIKPVNMNLTNDITSSWDESLRSSIRNYGSKYEIDRTVGYANVNADGSTMGTGSNILRVRLPLSSSLVSDAIAKRGTVSDLGLNEYVGIDQRAFNFSIPLFNVKDTSYESVLEVDGYSMGSYTSEDYSGLAAYGLMSENPFYYFSWYLYETGLSEESGISTGYKNLLLGSDNAGFFYNTKGNGEMKDFMDMRSLFTYIIPYLKQGNDLVDEWHDVYGIFIYDGVPIEEGLEDNLDISSDPELRQKYWHNINVMRLYNLYTPWVDIMYDCSYAKEEKISFLGEDYVIADPINPNSYPEERPMIFSRSEMLDYGLSEKDLTKVEKLILKCQDGMQERMFKLLNYHTFNDVVLNTAAAMNCAFEFNTTFSENSLVGEGHNIYPQAFELNDFSYDAFLRFILSNTTGDSMITNKGDSFYETVVNNSSMTTTIVLLVLDILAMYVIPGCKMFFIVGIFILVFLIILATAFRVDQEQKFITKLIRSFIIPVFKFMLVTCGMALVVSWFMGEGSTAITGSMETSISVGDPVMVMMLMIVLNCFVVYFYSKILLDVVKDIKSTGKMVGAYMGGVIGSFGGTVVSSVTSNTSYSNGGSHSGKVSAQGHTNPRANERGTVVIERVKEREETVNSFNDRSYGSSKDDRTYGNKSKSKSRKNYSSNIEEKTKKGMKNLSGKED